MYVNLRCEELERENAALRQELKEHKDYLRNGAAGHSSSAAAGNNITGGGYMNSSGSGAASTTSSSIPWGGVQFCQYVEMGIKHANKQIFGRLVLR